MLSPAPQVQSKRAGMEAALAADPAGDGAADALDDGASEVTPRCTGLRQRIVLADTVRGGVPRNSACSHACSMGMPTLS